MTRVAIVALQPAGEPVGFWPSYAASRLLAELLSEGIPGVDARLFSGSGDALEPLLERVQQFAPDVLACSAYVWSFAALLRVAAETKRQNPAATVVLGGPSARRAMFELEPYRDAIASVDALVVGEGERVLCQLVASRERDRSALARLPGVSVRLDHGFGPPSAPAPVDLDALASPYENPAIPQSGVAMLETYRGCPLSCAFCQWGNASGRPNGFSAATIRRTLAAIGAIDPTTVLLADAAINLNAAAFLSLVRAEEELGVLERIPFSFELFARRLSPELLRFFERVRVDDVGIGLQSSEVDVLRHMGRPGDVSGVQQAVQAVLGVGGRPSVELIMGLPFDGPDTFLATLERTLSLGCNVRVFHCLALPDALLTHAPAGADIRIDPSTLKVLSCAGWPAPELERMAQRMDAMASVRLNGQFSTWLFEQRPEAARQVELDLVALGAACLADAGVEAWKLVHVKRLPDGLSLTLDLLGEAVVVDVRADDPARRAFSSAGGVSLSYRGTPSSNGLAVLREGAARVLPRLAKLIRASG